MSSYNETDPVPKDLDLTTPTEGATPPAEVNNAIREAKRVLKVESAIITTTGNLQLTEQHSTVLINGAHTVTLPTIANVSSSTFTKRYRIINISASTGVLKTKAGGETLNGNNYASTGLNLAEQYAEYVIYGNGTVWYMETSYILASPTISGTVDGSATYTTPTLTSPVLNTGVSGTAVLDENDLTGDSATKVATQQSLKAYSNTSFESRTLFIDNDATTPFTYKLNSARYFFRGTKAEFIYWNSQLTTVAASAPGANVWVYLYINDTAIVARTGMTFNQITDVSAPATLIWSITVPAYSQIKHGFYNGDDRCIFAAKADAANTGFVLGYHDGGDYFAFDAEIEDRALADLDTAAVDVILSMPNFREGKGQVSFQGFASTAAVKTNTLYRKKGGTGFHKVLVINEQITGTGVNANSPYSLNTVIVLSDSSQTIQVKNDASNPAQLAVFTNGWYFPKGL